MRMRLIDSGAATAALNMGIDEALLGAVAEGRSPPVLRLYRWVPSAVTVGYFQGMREEVDLAACAAAGVDAVRRQTGGGAVFHDAEITYSVIVPEGGPLAPPDILSSYRLICAGIIAGLGSLGVGASFAPINDIVAAGADGVPRKVSGNAQTRRRGCLLQHGTILLDVDVERMFSLLLVPQEKLKGKLIEDVKARVTSLRALLGREPGYGEAAAALRAGFAAAWAGEGVEFMEDRLAEGELAAARELARTKYGTDDWNLRR